MWKQTQYFSPSAACWKWEIKNEESLPGAQRDNRQRVSLDAVLCSLPSTVYTGGIQLFGSKSQSWPDLLRSRGKANNKSSQSKVSYSFLHLLFFYLFSLGDCHLWKPIYQISPLSPKQDGLLAQGAKEVWELVVFLHIHSEVEQVCWLLSISALHQWGRKNMSFSQSAVLPHPSVCVTGEQCRWEDKVLHHELGLPRRVWVTLLLSCNEWLTFPPPFSEVYMYL